LSFSEFLKRFLVVFVVLLLWAGLWAARTTILLGVAAAIIAVGINIPVGRLQRSGWRRGWALTTVIVAFVLILLVLLLWLIPRLFGEFTTLLETIPNAFRAFVRVYSAIRSRSPFLSAALPAPPDVNDTAIDPVAARALLKQFVNAGLAIAPTLWGQIKNVVTVIVNF
jgi:predicted PurR-regulated permease PerM